MNRKRSVSSAVGALVAAAVAGSVAYATIPGPDNVYSACMLKGIGTIRLIDKSLPSTNLMSRCTDKETEVSWNRAGQAGPPGPQGVKGEPGAPGTNGTNGTDGKDGVSVTTASEPAGASCAGGGVQLTAANGVSYVCNGERGPQGDRGPQGEPGAQGAQGPPGPAGQSVTGVDGLWGESGDATDWSGGGFIGFHQFGFESRNTYIVPFTVTFNTFDCVQSVGHADGTATLWVRINGVDVSTPCVMNGTATSASVAGTHALTAGDLVSVRALTTGSFAAKTLSRILGWRLH
jgi:hypothetical protein